MNKDIIIIAEHQNHKTLPVTFELVSLARCIREYHGGRISIMVLEGPDSPVSDAIAQKTGIDVEAVRLTHDSPLTGETCLKVLGKILKHRQFSTLIIPHTALGTDYSAGLAVILESACISGITDIKLSESRLVFKRPVFGGKFEEQDASQAPKVILTAAPGVFKAPSFFPACKGESTITQAPSVTLKTAHLRNIPAGDQDESLSEAGVIVAAGNGIGSQESLALINQMAQSFTRSAVAGSRPVCDRGWLPYNRQVGVTGTSVSPRLYIACGISGAFQHIAGMQESEFIVSINTDPDSAIFNVSDLCIIHDLKIFIPAFIQCLQDTQENETRPK